MCRRSDKDKDPLVRLLTDSYRLNILRVPRAGINVGDLLLCDSGALRNRGGSASFSDPPLELPVSRNEPLAPVSREASRAISGRVAVNPLAAFLAALGVPAITALTAELHAARKLN